MTRRRLLWAGAVLLVLRTVAGLGWVPFWLDPVNRVTPGMTLEEVEAALGADAQGPQLVWADDGLVLYCWQMRDGPWASVSFATKDGMSKKQLTAMGSAGVGNSSLLARLRALLGW